MQCFVLNASNKSIPEGYITKADRQALWLVQESQRVALQDRIAEQEEKQQLIKEDLLKRLSAVSVEHLPNGTFDITINTQVLSAMIEKKYQELCKIQVSCSSNFNRMQSNNKYKTIMSDLLLDMGFTARESNHLLEQPYLHNFVRDQLKLKKSVSS